MRLGKRERALLKLQEHNRKVMARKAQAVPDNGGTYVSSCKRLLRREPVKQGNHTPANRSSLYQAKDDRRLTSKGRKVLS